MFSFLLKTITVFNALLLLLSCASVFINPNTLWHFSFFGFAFIFLFAANLLLLLWWLLRFNLFVVVPALALLVSWKQAANTFALNFKEEPKEQGIKLLTWNVKNFDLYNWSKNAAARQQMMALIKKENPYVLCLQEFYTNNQNFKNLEYLRDTLGFTHVYFYPRVEITGKPRNVWQKTLWKNESLTQQWGVATFSKFPIVESGKTEFDNKLVNGCIYTDVDFGNEVVRIHNVHLESVHLGYEDYETLDEIEQSRQTNRNKIFRILRKMKRAYGKRALQAKELRQDIDTHSGLQVLCGDFNDVPVSYTYRNAGYGLKDAFIEKGKGLGFTYFYHFPLFRIDYVLLHEKLQVNSYRTIRKELSDHYPVAVTFSF
ncbi:MAG: endonuclease/exonuclease/phosphatase family protein [Chitinophagales bacterium]|nr:endonuclease/exonuclease/phosphatase family protein [Chitinophagales bacterium]